MGPAPSQYVGQNQGLAIPDNDRLPWSVWSSTVFQTNINNGCWQPWNSVCFGNINSEHQQNAQLSEKVEFFSSKVSSFDEIQTKPGDFVADQSVCLQNSINQNRMKNIHNSNLSIKGDFPPKKKTKNRKKKSSKTVLKQVASNGSVSSSPGPGPLHQSYYQKWNHVPVFEWSQSNSLRPAEARLQYPFRSGSLNENSKYSDRFHTSARCEFTGSNLKIMPKRSRDYYRCGNYFARCKKVNFNSRTIYKKCPSETNMDGKKGRISSATSNNSGNSKEEDDIEYLFTVDSSSEAKMILEIDLQSDIVNLIPNSSSSKSQESKNKEEQSIIIEEPELNGPLSRKRKLSISNKETNKKPSYRLRCSACKMSYDDVTEKKEKMYISSACSHVFCGPCVSKNEKIIICPVCEVKIFSFRKLYR